MLLTNLAVSLAFVTSVLGSSVDWSLYHKTDQILDFFKDVSQKFPNKARYEEVRDPDSEFKLPLVTITDFSSGVSGKEVLLIVASEHARELITGEIVFWLGSLLTGERSEDFAEWAATQPVQATAWKNGWTKGTLSEWADQVLKSVVFKIFPVQNIAGRKQVESGSTCLRKTITGVDLNRNWPVAWKQAKAGSDEFGGSVPFSEPETRIVRIVAENVQPQAYVNLHSGEWAMYVPWDSRKEWAATLPADTPDLLDKMNAFCECMKGAGGEVAGYLAMGTSMDWMSAEQHVPYPLTFEVFGPKGLGKLSKGGEPRRRLLQQEKPDGVVPEEDACMSAFNPTAREDYESTVAGWVGSFLVLADHLIAHPHASAASHSAEQQQQPEPRTPVLKQELTEQEEHTVDEIPKESESYGLSSDRDLSFGRKGGSSVEALEKFEVPGILGSGSTALGYAAIVAIVAALLFLSWRKLRPAEGRLSPLRKHFSTSLKDSV